MNRKALTLLMICGLMTISLPVMADNLFDDTLDILKCRNENLPVNIYGAVTIDLEQVPYVNILNADLRIKAETTLGDKFMEEGLLSFGLEWKL